MTWWVQIDVGDFDMSCQLALEMNTQESQAYISDQPVMHMYLDSSAYMINSPYISVAILTPSHSAPVYVE